MLRGSCEQKDCTVAETGTCLLHGDPGKCPQFRPAISEEKTTSRLAVSNENADNLTSPVARRFHQGLELGTLDLATLMRKRYCHLIGILGPTNAGKTCFLNSLFLTACHGGLGDYQFAESLTPQGFEDRVRLVRRWKNGQLPDRLAEHTTLADPRSPAFLHLALKQRLGHRRRFDFLFPDLPGEWSTDLIDRVDTAQRFSFLHRADGILVMVDGKSLKSANSRHTEVHRTQLLFSRLAQSLHLDVTIPMVLLITKGDEIDMKLPEYAERIRSHAASLGFDPTVIVASSFSKNQSKVTSGTGVLAALENILSREAPAAAPHDKRELSTRMFSRGVN